MVSNCPPVKLRDDILGVVVSNPDYVWYKKGYDDCEQLMKFYRDELDKLACELDAQTQLFRQVKKELEEVRNGSRETGTETL